MAKTGSDMIWDKEVKYDIAFKIDIINIYLLR